MKICPKCHVGLLAEHPEAAPRIVGWEKCPVCAYCEINENTAKTAKQVVAQIYPKPSKPKD